LSITIKRYTATDSQRWDAFVQSSNNGTLFHYRSFLTYHIDRKFEDYSLIFEKKGKMIAVFSAAEVMDGSKKILCSHPGATFGGFIYDDLTFEDANEIVVNLFEYCKTKVFASIFLVQTPQLYNLRKNETLEYALHWHGFEAEETYFSSFIDLATEKEAIDFVSSRKRRYLKKNESNEKLRFEWNGNVDDFYPILCENKKKHGSQPTHSKAELIKLIDLMPEKFQLLMMYKDENPIGGTFNFIANSQVGIIFYNMINYKFEEFNPASHQILETMKWAKMNNLKYLDFGVSQLPQAENPLTPSPNLIRFKEQFSAKGMLRIAIRKKL